jgi:hypothetical protein
MLLNQLYLGLPDSISKRKLSSPRIDFFLVLVPVVPKNMQTYYAKADPTVFPGRQFVGLRHDLELSPNLLAR